MIIIISAEFLWTMLNTWIPDQINLSLSKITNMTMNGLSRITCRIRWDGINRLIILILRRIIGQYHFAT